MTRAAVVNRAEPAVLSLYPNSVASFVQNHQKAQPPLLRLERRNFYVGEISIFPSLCSTNDVQKPAIENGDVTPPGSGKLMRIKRPWANAAVLEKRG